MKNKFSYIIALVITIIAFIFVVNFMSFGAQSADSPAYIYLASRISYGQPLIFEDKIFNIIKNSDEPNITELSRPKQYKENNEKLVHNYPIGLSLLLALGYLIYHQPVSWYITYVLVCLLSLPLFYFLILKLIKKNKYKNYLAILGTILLFTNTFFFAYIISPPHRDLIILTIILAIILLLLKQNKFFIILAASLFSFGLITRLTIILFLPLIIFLLIYKQKNIIKKLILFFSATLIIWLIFIGIHFLLDGEFISLNHLINSQSDHVKTLNLKNTFSAKGHYQKDASNLWLYFKQLFINVYSTPLLALVFIFLGIFNLIKTNHKKLLIILNFWFWPYFLLFSSWSNAYPRYLLPILPVIIILSILGIIYLLNFINNFKKYNKTIYISAIILALLILQGQQFYVMATDANSFHDYHFEDSLTWQDYQKITDLKNFISAETNNPYVITDGLKLFELADVLEAHLNISILPIKATEFYDYKNIEKILAELQKNHDVILITENTQKIQSALKNYFPQMEKQTFSVANIRNAEIIILKKDEAN